MAAKKKARVPPKAKDSAHEKAELKALLLLCNKHGYTMSPKAAGKRVSMMMTNTLKDITPMYTMTLQVPMDSALAKRMLERYPVKRQ
jgi:hypothetical protein